MFPNVIGNGVGGDGIKKKTSPLKKILPSEVKKIVPETDKNFFGLERLSPRPLYILLWNGMEWKLFKNKKRESLF